MFVVEVGITDPLCFDSHQMLRRYRSDGSHILPVQAVQVQENFSYDEEPKAILAREVKQLRNK